MLGSRFFWKLYLAFAGLVLITIVATGFLVHQQLRSSLLADVETRLRDMALSLVPHAMEAFETLTEAASDAEGGTAATSFTGTGAGSPGGEPLSAAGTTEPRSAGAPGETAEASAAVAAGLAPYDPALQAEIVRLGRQTESRITLIAPDGTVVADSEQDPRTMENHSRRPEVVDAQSRAYGVSSRYSETVDESLLYVAVAARRDGRFLGTVRTSIPLAAVDARLAWLRNTIAVGAGLGVLVAMLVGLVVARRITAPLAQMTEVAEALRRGHYEQRVAAVGDDEIGSLGATLNRLADELTERIAILDGQRAQLGAMVSELQEGVLAVDAGERLIFSNPAARRLLGLPEEPGDEPAWVIIDVPDLEQLCAAARESRTAQRVVRIENGGAEVLLDARATSFESAGQQSVVLVLYDVTNLRRLEGMRTEFVANISHELKTPLTSIRGYVETLISGAIHDDANNLRFLGKIEQQVERLTAMVSDVLSLARIEGTERRVAAQPVDWRSVIESVVERYRDAGKLADHGCVTEMPDQPVAIEGDVESMTQVLDNLLDNAVKYTPRGGKITIRTLRRGGQAVLEVEDTGIGISVADRERIFERFFRTDRARSRDTGGTGLGLAIVKHLAQRLGGEVRVTSELGKGSRFSVSAPAAPAT
jgi:two-component system phosphate regulon sensor histidine kinase PhoR